MDSNISVERVQEVAISPQAYRTVSVKVNNVLVGRGVPPTPQQMKPANEELFGNTARWVHVEEHTTQTLQYPATAHQWNAFLGRSASRRFAPRRRLRIGRGVENFNKQLLLSLSQARPLAAVTKDTGVATKHTGTRLAHAASVPSSESHSSKTVLSTIGGAFIPNTCITGLSPSKNGELLIVSHFDNRQTTFLQT